MSRHEASSSDRIPGPPLRWIATCPEETKGVLVDELIALGVSSPSPLFRGVAFEADLEMGYQAHLCLRTASRIQRVVAELPATSTAELEDSARKIAWSSWLRPDRPFAVSTILTDGSARSLGEEAVSTAVANAVVASFTEKDAQRVPRLDLEVERRASLVAHLRGGCCTLGLDTAGRALHKRGWRLPGHPAVLKETLAAAVLLLAGYDGTEPLLDPMCGSGTLIIEGAYLALGKAPLIHRGKDDFGFEHHAGFERTLWRKVSERARLAKRPEPSAPLFASDLKPEYVELAQKTALRARVERHITFSTASIYNLVAPVPHGLLVANLPYGARIGRGEILPLFREMGHLMRERFAGWRAALLVPDHVPNDAFSLQPERIVPLMNGALAVKLLLFGSRISAPRCR